MVLPTVAIPTRTVTPTPESLADAMSDNLDEIGTLTTVLRELSATDDLPTEFITRQELGKRLIEDLGEERDDIDESTEIYKTLGILDGDQDLYEIYINLFGEGVLGFFDSEDEKLFIVEDDDRFSSNDILTYAHEYVHGLQQQHFDIHNLIDGIDDNSDASKALRGLIEGDATLVQTIYLFTQFDESRQQEVFEEVQAVDQQAFNSAPHVVQRDFVFPYREGLDFTLYLWSTGRDWGLVNQAFQDLPQSTEQILHPQKYIDGEAPVEVHLPDLLASLGEGWEHVTEDTFGEFFLMTYLETSLPVAESSTAAEGWGGDRFTLARDGDGRNVLASIIKWDTEPDGKEFFDAFIQLQAAQTNAIWESRDGLDNELLLKTPDQHILASLTELETLFIFAPDADSLALAKSAFDTSD